MFHLADAHWFQLHSVPWVMPPLCVEAPRLALGTTESGPGQGADADGDQQRGRPGPGRRGLAGGSVHRGRAAGLQCGGTGMPSSMHG